jgi:hypothetical protein
MSKGPIEEGEGQGREGEERAYTIINIFIISLIICEHVVVVLAHAL